MAAARRSRGTGAAAMLLLLAIVAGLAIATSRHQRMAPGIGSGCLVRARSVVVPLTTDQAGLAAVIAGVAQHRSMPVQAVTIAYATALQESGLADLPFGDRDSVGIFQQRPSQGWGPRQLLLDPVYASTRFFQALTRVRDYRHLLIYQAAQAVQHSANGYAYAQYAGQGAVMAAGFSGQVPRSVWCWYSAGTRVRARLAAASSQLDRAFGRLSVHDARDPAVRVRVSQPAAGWSVASWLVTHAAEYGIKAVGFDGYAWTAAAGSRGWIKQHARRGRGKARLAVTFA